MVKIRLSQVVNFRLSFRGGGGLMETAFPPVDMDDYIERRGFILLERIEEVLEWKN